MNNLRRISPKTTLILGFSLALMAIFVLLTRFDIKAYFREPPIASIVGKWRVISDNQEDGESIFYEFRDDGTYLYRTRFSQLMGPSEELGTYSGFMNTSEKGHYTLSRHNWLTLVGKFGSKYSFKISSLRQGLVSGDRGENHWYRVK